MTKNKQQDNHTPNRSTYQLMLPLEIEIKIEASEAVHLMLKITERLDYSKLEASYTRKSGKNEATAKQMFQLVTLGFMEGVYSTKKLESACKHDIRFMYVLRGKKAPDHNKFWGFIKHRLQGEVAENLFYQVTSYLEEMGEIDYSNVFIDGTKIEANANKYSFVWKKSTNKYEARLDEKIENLLADIAQNHPKIKPSASNNEYLSQLKSLAKDKNINFVHGRGKRKTQLQRDIETLEAYLIRKDKYQAYNKTFKNRNSFSKTDMDATFMRMKDDHMMNGQLKPAYNLQLAVEGEYIVGLDISSERNDTTTLIPLLERIEKGSGRKHENVTCDAGYESEENYKALQKRGQTAYIKPMNYEKSKKRKYKNNAYLRENMPYNQETDTYTCPQGNLFSNLYTTTRKSISGFESIITVYECQSCNHCPRKKLCSRAKGNRRISVSKDFIILRKESLAKITSEKGKILRLNRSIQVEGAFGVLKQDYGFKRFLRRGTANVFTEATIFAIAYNTYYMQKRNANFQVSSFTH